MEVFEMYSIPKVAVGAPKARSNADTKGDGNAPKSEDLWLFTDPSARLMYFRQGRLAHLRWDIRTHVMCNWRWSPDELEFKRELKRLIKANVLKPLPAFGHLSPHPTIYQAVEEGFVEVAGEKYYFGISDQIVFEPWLVRLSHPGLRGPLRIGRLDTTTKFHLCCEAFPELEGLYEKDILALHNTLYYYSSPISQA
jgi:hypothetical protein